MEDYLEVVGVVDHAEAVCVLYEHVEGVRHIVARGDEHARRPRRLPAAWSVCRSSLPSCSLQACNASLGEARSGGGCKEEEWIVGTLHAWKKRGAPGRLPGLTTHEAYRDESYSCSPEVAGVDDIGRQAQKNAGTKDAQARTHRQYHTLIF
jgi:hypothetical protein